MKALVGTRIQYRDTPKGVRARGRLAKSVREERKVRVREDLWTSPSPLLGEIKSRERKREEKKQTVISTFFAT